MLSPEHQLFASGLFVVLGEFVGANRVSNTYRNIRAWLILGVGLALFTGALLTAGVLESELLHPVSAATAGILLLAFAYSGQQHLRQLHRRIEQYGEVMIDD